MKETSRGRLSRLGIAWLLVFSAISFPVSGQIASEAVFDLEWANVYVEIFPDQNELEGIAQLFLTGNGSDPVVLRCGGNFKKLTIEGEKGQVIGYHLKAPYISFTRLASGAQILKVYFRAGHSSLVSDSQISPQRLQLGVSSFWYPRNVASDAHQVLLNVVSPEDFNLESNGEKTRDVPNNLKRLRTFLLETPSEEGLTLTGNP